MGGWKDNIEGEKTKNKRENRGKRISEHRKIFKYGVRNIAYDVNLGNLFFGSFECQESEPES